MHQREFVFLTNHYALAPSLVAAVYRERRQVELFFKALKQNLRVKTFVGTSANALKTRIWTALLAILVMGVLQLPSRFGWSLSRLVALSRLQLFVYRNLWKWLDEPFEPPPLEGKPSRTSHLRRFVRPPCRRCPAGWFSPRRATVSTVVSSRADRTEAAVCGGGAVFDQCLEARPGAGHLGVRVHDSSWPEWSRRVVRLSGSASAVRTSRRLKCCWPQMNAPRKGGSDSISTSDIVQPRDELWLQKSANIIG